MENEKKAVTPEDTQKVIDVVSDVAQELAKKDGQPKYKSWMLWLSVGSLVVLVINIMSGNDFTSVGNIIINGALGALSALGIINNPNSSTKL